MSSPQERRAAWVAFATIPHYVTGGRAAEDRAGLADEMLAEYDRRFKEEELEEKEMCGMHLKHAQICSHPKPCPLHDES